LAISNRVGGAQPTHSSKLLVERNLDYCLGNLLVFSFTNQPIMTDLGYPLGYLHYSVFFQLNLPIKTALGYRLGYVCYTRHQSRQTYVTI